MPVSQMSPPTEVPATSTATSTAGALAQTLESLGVKYLFGMDSPEALYAELRRPAITPITVRDERCGAVMADAYARVSRRPGVCTGLHGAGATNLVQGVIEAWCASTPVVVLASELSRSTRYRNELQDIDHAPFFSSITKWIGRIEAPHRVSELTTRGFSIATSGRPGPVYLGYPADVLTTEPAAVAALIPGPAEYPAHRVAPDDASIGRAVELLAGASRPSIIAGGGVLISGATEELAAFARALKAPVATTPLGKGAFDEFDPRWAGIVGAYTGGVNGRGRIANDLVSRSDVVVLVGSKTDSVATADWTVPDPGTTIIHVDVDPAEIGRNYPTSVPVVGDAKLALAALTARLDDRSAHDEWAIADLNEAAAEWKARVASLESDREPLRPERVYREVAQVLDDNTIVTTDASYSSAWAIDMLQFRAPGRRFLAPRGYGSLGWGLPAAIGAKLAAPDKNVICITGDGGFGYVFQELETAARYGIPVTVIVLNNNALGFQRHYEERFFGGAVQTDLLDVDHALLATALKCEGIRIERAADLGDALASAIAGERPTVIDVHVDQDAHPAITWFD